MLVTCQDALLRNDTLPKNGNVLVSRQKEADWLDQGDMADRYPIKCHKNENRALKPCLAPLNTTYNLHRCGTMKRRFEALARRLACEVHED